MTGGPTEAEWPAGQSTGGGYRSAADAGRCASPVRGVAGAHAPSRPRAAVVTVRALGWEVGRGEWGSVRRRGMGGGVSGCAGWAAMPGRHWSSWSDVMRRLRGAARHYMSARRGRRATVAPSDHPTHNHPPILPQSHQPTTHLTVTVKHSTLPLPLPPPPSLCSSWPSARWCLWP